jgi:hypothetical protein
MLFFGEQMFQVGQLIKVKPDSLNRRQSGTFIDLDNQWRDPDATFLILQVKHETSPFGTGRAMTTLKLLNVSEKRVCRYFTVHDSLQADFDIIDA